MTQEIKSQKKENIDNENKNQNNNNIENETKKIVNEIINNNNSNEKGIKNNNDKDINKNNNNSKNSIYNDIKNEIDFNNIIIKKNGPLTSRNKKSKITYQSSDELMKISMKKIKGSSKKQDYTNEHFKSNLPKFAEHLPKSIYHVYQYNNKNICKKCMICMENFLIGQEILTLPCFHFFHCKCISNWLVKQKKCPICKNHI